MTVSLRPATAKDAAFAKAIKYEGLSPYIRATWGWDETLQEDFFAKDYDVSSYYIITSGNVDAGTIKIVVTATAVEIGNLCVAANYRRQGIGTAAIGIAEHIAALLGKPVRLDVLKVNPAKALYERLGYAVYREDAHHFHVEKTVVA